MSIPRDQKLYDKIKEDLKKKYVWPSAYASMSLVKKYKEEFYKKHGHRRSYIGRKPKTMQGLQRWRRERWVNICETDKNGKFLPCGSKDATRYPYCRPMYRISEDTPVTVNELTFKQRERLCRRKRKTALPKDKKSRMIDIRLNGSS